MSKGRIEVVDSPVPRLAPESVLVSLRASLLSPGTERRKVLTAQQSLLGKARARPDQVAQVMDKVRSDGVRETIAAVRTRLEQPNPLGYSAAGVVIAAGELARGLAVGDRVACGGGGYANHAEIDHVPGNLCVRLPADVSFEQGAFATIGAVALHGVRQAELSLGENVAVVGLGLVGQLAAQMCKAAGCTVLGVDLDEQLIAETQSERTIDFGATLGAGAELADRWDAILVTAATTSSDPLKLAAVLARDRARVVVVGDVGLEVPRAPFYDKEIELRLSRSYGPGRYDRNYEERGLDYPIGYVRWTERRNMQTVLSLIEAGRLDVERLIRRRVALENAPQAYAQLAQRRGSPLGILITYGEQARPGPEAPPAREARAAARSTVLDRAKIGVIGAGSFAQRILIPGLAKAGFELREVASQTGTSAASAASRFGFARAATVEELLQSDECGSIAIATRHDSHAELAVRALDAGKAVFLEKPACLSIEQLRALSGTVRERRAPLAVGFNRRHSALARTMKAHFVPGSGPLAVLYRVNAPRLPEGSWINDPESGGGRLVSEGCHFVDFVCWVIGQLPTTVSCVARTSDASPLASPQSFQISLSFADRSIATILYVDDGSEALAKEYVEVHGRERSARLEGYRRLDRWHRREHIRTTRRRADKGHMAQFVAFKSLVQGEIEPEPPSYLETMRATLLAAQSLCTGQTVVLDEP